MKETNAPSDCALTLKPGRVVSMFHSSDKQLFTLIRPFTESYPAAYDTLLQAKPITCATSGITFAAVPAPVAVIMDVRSSGFHRIENYILI
jgi:hypothetical protein